MDLFRSCTSNRITSQDSFVKMGNENSLQLKGILHLPEGSFKTLSLSTQHEKRIRRLFQSKKFLPKNQALSPFALFRNGVSKTSSFKKQHKTKNLQCPQSHEKILKILQQQEWVSALELYAQSCPEDILKEALQGCRTKIVATLVNSLKDRILPTSSPSQIVLEPHLELLLRLHSLYSKIHGEFLLQEYLTEKQVQSHLPSCLQAPLENTSAIETLQKLQKVSSYIQTLPQQAIVTPKEISKTKSGLAWSLLLIPQKDKKVSLYVIGEKLGKGSYKKIHACISLDGETNYALGTSIDYDRECGQKDLAHERKVSKVLHDSGSRYTVKIWPITYNGTTKNLMELCDGGILRSASKELPLLERMRLGYELSVGLAAMHSLSICHLDLKNKNVFTKIVNGRPEVRLGDFGAAKTIHKNNGSQNSTWMSCTYPPPEMAQRYHAHKATEVDPALDLWALGTLLYDLKYGTSPLLDNKLVYTDLHKDEDFRQKHGGPSQFIERTEKVSREVYKKLKDSDDPVDRLLRDLFSIDPKKRPSAKTVASAIETWIKKHEGKK